MGLEKRHVYDGERGFVSTLSLLTVTGDKNAQKFDKFMMRIITLSIVSERGVSS